MSFKVEITNFESEADAVQFCSWFCGSGEQDLSIWLECRKDDGLDVSSSIYSDSYSQNADQNNIVHMKVKSFPFEED